jgi:hypothetical protein
MIKNYAIAMFLLCVLSNTKAQTTIQINLNQKGGPDLNYKRGVAAPGVGGFFDDQQTRAFLDKQKELGMEIFNGIRNIYKDPLTDEFYQEGGVFKNRQIAPFTDIRKYANALNFEMISQVGGTPTNSGYDLALNYSCTCEDYAPIPAVGTSMTEFQRNFSEWAINADKAVAPNFHSIWIGTQEITHTIGFLDAINDDAKRTNIVRFIDYWKPIAANLRTAGAKVGGIQMNSSTAYLYQYAVDYMKTKNVKMDYLTYQFYQWGDTNDLRKAVNALDSYNEKYPGTKIIIDRGWSGKFLVPNISDKILESYNMLVGELGIMNYADKIYAYTLDRSINGFNNKTISSPLWQTKAWLNDLAKNRITITSLPDGVAGFATKDTDKVTMAFWNSKSTKYDLSFKLNGADFPANALISIKKASDSTITDITSNWDETTQRISGITLSNSEFILVTITKPKVVSTIENETHFSNFQVYPNPFSDLITINSNSEILDWSLKNNLGTEIKHGKEKSIDVSSLSEGLYFIQINDVIHKIIKQ